MVSEETKEKIVANAIQFFKEKIVPNHLSNIKKASCVKAYKLHRFLNSYLTNFFIDEEISVRKARALLYPRVLGSSITTSFGTNIQKFFSKMVLGDFAPEASIGDGLDIEFKDQLDGRLKYCQLKAGPNTINKDDVATVCNHFKKVIGLAGQNGRFIPTQDLVVGVVYGTQKELSFHYKAIQKENYSVMIGKDFWQRLTGDENFYERIIQAIVGIELPKELNDALEEAVQKLALDIREKNI